MFGQMIPVITCTCGQQAPYVNTYYPGDGAIDHVDIYQCPLSHVIQVVYPVVVERKRMKPDTPPPFPGWS
jgi:hypothetical protein